MTEYPMPPWTTIEEQRQAERYEELVRQAAAAPGKRMVVVFCADCAESTARDRVLGEVTDTPVGALFVGTRDLGELAQGSVRDKDGTGRRQRAPWTEVRVLVDVPTDDRPLRVNGAPTTATVTCPKHGTGAVDEVRLQKSIKRYRKTGSTVRVAQRQEEAVS